jgi:hypothetical protein
MTSADAAMTCNKAPRNTCAAGRATIMWPNDTCGQLPRDDEHAAHLEQDRVLLPR